jgi:hypothetical protein
MKRMLTLLAGIAMTCTAMAQTDSTKQKSDTIRIGNMIIVKTPGNEEQNERQRTRIYHRTHKPSAVSTNWFILDLGFANYDDKTNYSGAEAQAFAPGGTKDMFKLRTVKSSNFNIWILMQRLNVIKHVVNLKYGVGLETNNYRFEEPVKFETEPTTKVVLDKDTHYKKNKLSADYVTVPMMLNFNFTPKREKGFSVSVGASAGYLYASRQKTITEADGKRKKRDDFDLRPWKLSYIAEMGMGGIKLYGSLATQSMFEKGLDMTPYAVGVRLSSW